MADFLLVVIAAFVAAGIVFGIAVLATGSDPGLSPADPDRRPRTLPKDRPLVERDVAAVRFDTAVRGYRMADVDEVLRRLGYDIGYKGELIRVMEAELAALRAGEVDQAEELRRMRLAALGVGDDGSTGAVEPDEAVALDAGDRGSDLAAGAAEPLAELSDETQPVGKVETPAADEAGPGDEVAEADSAGPVDEAAVTDAAASDEPAGDAPAGEPDGVGSRRG